SGAPTASVRPSDESASVVPKPSEMPVFDAFTYACCAHVVPERVNTYAAPESGAALLDGSPPTPVAFESSVGAPTTSVDPSPASVTAKPNSSAACVLEALTYACCDHVVPVRVSTYTAPAHDAALLVWSPPTPVAADDSWGAPTASVDPSVE